MAASSKLFSSVTDMNQKLSRDICGDVHHKLFGKFSTFTKELVGLVGMELCVEEMTELLGICCSTSSIVFSVPPP